MNKKKLLSMFLALTMILSMAVPVLAADDVAVTPYAIPDVKGQLVILHTNDTHGADEAKAGKSFGTAGVAQLKMDFEAAGAEVLLLSAGDAIMGKPLVSESKGATAVAFMNAAKYDAMTIGNHEMDFGYDNLKELVKLAKFPILNASVLDSKTMKPVFEANKVFTTASGLKVGVFGLSTPETLTKADASKMPGITFPQDKELYKVAQTQVDALKKAGADLVVCLGHLGVDEESVGNRSVDVVNNVTGIDLFVDGHSHTEMKDGKPVKAADYPTYENKSKTMIVSTGTALANVGVVVYDKTAKTLTPSLVSAKEYDKVDATVAALVAAESAKVTAKYGAAFAKTEIDLNGSKSGGKTTSTKGVDVTFPEGIGNRTAETNLGDFATDAILWQARKTLGADKVDAALTNGGGIRMTISAGDISMLDMLEVFPFGNTVATIEVTGAQLLEALEAASSYAPTALGAFAQVSGIEYTVKTAVPYENGELYAASTYFAPAKPGSRVTILTVNGKAFDLKANYVIATNDFTAKGGDTFCVFKTVGGWKDTGTTMEAALIGYTKDVLKGVITAKQYGNAGNRIIVVPADVVPGGWYEVAANYALTVGTMKGTNIGFEPNATVTRATIYQILFNMEGKPAAGTEKVAFSDIEGQWFAPAAQWASVAGIAAGDKDGKFNGNEAITRGELAKIIAAYAKLANISADKSGTTMKDASDYAAIPAEYLDGMTFCFYNGVMTGDQDGKLNPIGNLTRAELAQVMFNFGKLPVPAAKAA